MPTQIPLSCDHCLEAFLISLKHYNKKLLRNDASTFCSNKCRFESVKRQSIVECEQCATSFTKPVREIAKTKHNFCSSSCAATYNNTHKTKGIRRSKLEHWLEVKLTELFPELTVVYNDKQAIKSELDIYIPELSLAFELNGIFHYEPIFSAEKLAKIQNNDARKFQACLESGIELCIIDTSSLTYFKDKKAQKFLDVIAGIINVKLKMR